MDNIIIKAFIPEIFFSLALLIQIVVNTKVVNSSKYNYPTIEKEIFSQSVFIFIMFLFLLNSLEIEGHVSNYLLYTTVNINLFKQIFTLICLLNIIIVYQAHLLQKITFYEFYILFLGGIFGLFLMISTLDLLLFYLGMEIQALCFYVLASSNRGSIFSIESGLKYFISGSFISSAYLLGISILYACLGTLNLNDISSMLSSEFIPYCKSTSIVDFFKMYSFLLNGIILIICTFLFKLASAPFHSWSPDVYEGGPLYSTIIFSVIPKMPLYYFFMKFINALGSFAPEVLLPCGLFSIIIGTLFALSQKRLKRVVAYSSIVQTGFIISAVSINSSGGYTYAFFFLILYMTTSLLIWGTFVLFYLFFQNYNDFFNKKIKPLYLSTMSNLYKYNPNWTVIYVVAFFSIGGIPPLTGFLSKMLVVSGLMDKDLLIEAIVIVIVSSISVYYYIRIIKVVFFEPSIKVKCQEFKISYVDNELEFLFYLLTLLTLILLITFYSPSITLNFSEIIGLKTLTN